MFDFRKIFFGGLSLGLALASSACDVEGDCADSEICECPDGEICEDELDGGADTEVFTYSHVVVVDTSDVENQNGTPGVDICGMIVTCDGRESTAIDSTFDEGSGSICSAGEAGCSADRGVRSAAEDNGARCDANSIPSDYVSIGVDGTLILQMAANRPVAIGCTVEVIELRGRDVESYDVYVCTENIPPANATEGECTKLGSVSSGGSASFDVTE